MATLEQRDESSSERLYVFGGTALAVAGMFNRSSLGSLGLLLLGGALVAKGLQARDQNEQRISEPIAKAAGEPDKGLPLRHRIFVSADPAAVYRFWRNLENLPKFMPHLVSVREAGEGKSIWTAKGPLDATVTWDAEIVEDVPGEVIAWRSLAGAAVENEGRVEFEASGPGTRVTVAMHYKPPLGIVGATVAKLLGEDPSEQIAGDLQTAKRLLEAGNSKGSVL